MNLTKYQASVIKTMFLIGGILLGTELVLIAYDKWGVNDDGFILNFHIINLFKYFWFGWFLLTGIVWGVTSKHLFLQNLGLSGSAFAVMWILLEMSFFCLFKLEIIKVQPPPHRFTTLYEPPHRFISGDENALFAHWSAPNDSTFRVRPQGDSIWLHYNGFGARDKQRSLQRINTKKRIAVIGDSFVEGYIINSSQRFTDIMEKKTGCEHLNFGINGTGLIDYYLKYKYLVKRFEHDVVIIGILPANDFSVYEENQLTSLFDFPTYRPYWHQLPNNKYDIRYSLANLNQSMFSRSATKDPRIVVKTVDSLYKVIDWYQRPFVQLSQNSYLYNAVLAWGTKKNTTRSEYNILTSKNLQVLDYFLNQLKTEAAKRKVLIITFPLESEMRGENLKEMKDFSRYLQRLCLKNGCGYVDILPYFKNYKGNIADLYTQGDGHWNAKGDSLAALAIMNHPVYKDAIK